MATVAAFGMLAGGVAPANAFTIDFEGFGFAGNSCAGITSTNCDTNKNNGFRAESLYSAGGGSLAGSGVSVDF
jgi:hypothetical protein